MGNHLFALSLRGQETLRSLRARLYGQSNHIHLLIKDTGSNVIAQSMQLIAGRTAQEYNQRKGKRVHSGKIVITPRPSRSTSTCIAVCGLH
jgi:hypothetical protein